MRLNYLQRLLLLSALGLGGALILIGRLVHLQILQHDRYVEVARRKSVVVREVPGFRGKILDARGRVLAADAPAFDLMIRVRRFKARLHRCENCSTDHFFDVDAETLEFRKPEFCRVCRQRPRPGRKLFEFRDDRDLRPMARLLGVSPAELEARILDQCDRVDRLIEDKLDVRRVTDTRKRARARATLRADYYRRLRPVRRDVPYEVVREVELNRDRNPFFFIRVVQNRIYPEGANFSHLLGRMGWGPDFIERAADGSAKEAFLGIEGLERKYERELRGRPGELSMARRPGPDGQREVSYREPRHGQTLQLTLSARDQAAAHDAVGHVMGAFIVIDARTGGVLAMATRPTYQRDEYVELMQEMVERTNTKPRERKPGRYLSPLLERTCREHYAPGSILKPVTALAALAAGQAQPDEIIECDGYFYIDGRRLPYLKCHAAHGPLDLPTSLAKSCNIYVQTLIRRDACFASFVHTGRRLGLGRPTGIEIEHGRFLGHFPADTADWNRHLRIAAATGQGDITVSPAQIARMYAAIKTGRSPRLHLVARVGDRPVVRPAEPLGIDAAVLDPVRAGLARVTQPGGAADDYGLSAYGISCKTGTAVLRTKDDPATLKLYNAWIAGFAPGRGDRPAIAFAMVVLRTELSSARACGPRLQRFFRAFYRSESDG
ncbi:MAG: penicillin-binding transpeptidase domain-containing protein [Planctomycetota bacterium]